MPLTKTLAVKGYCLALISEMDDDQLGETMRVLEKLTKHHKRIHSAELDLFKPEDVIEAAIGPKGDHMKPSTPEEELRRLIIQYDSSKPSGVDSIAGMELIEDLLAYARRYYLAGLLKLSKLRSGADVILAGEPRQLEVIPAYVVDEAIEAEEKKLDA